MSSKSYRRPFVNQSVATVPPILITGPPRVGKSLVALGVGRVTGLEVVRTDDLRGAFWGIADPDARIRERRCRYRDLVAGTDPGVVLEGDDLVFVNRAHPAVAAVCRESQDMSLTLDQIIDLMDRHDALAYVIGCSDADTARKTSEIRTSQKPDDFTAAMNEHQLTHFVENQIERSKLLRKMTEGSTVHYLEIRGGNFHQDVAAAVTRICRDIKSRCMHAS